ncbi:DUF5706 domain-containing protein [candidate division KSB1 bacterium]|nr:DUF5706 domain-containing protein [candidate division KSB1 bacterium]
MKSKNADRATDNLFRIMMNNHHQLSALADHKASMIITVCSIIIGLVVQYIIDPTLQYGAITLALTCLVTILLAVYSTLPKYESKREGAMKAKNPAFNVIFFGDFTHLDYPEFERELEKVINDHDLVYESLAKDVYSLGRVLHDKKYRFIRYAYLTFMIGLVISGIILALTVHGGSPPQ